MPYCFELWLLKVLGSPWKSLNVLESPWTSLKVLEVLGSPCKLLKVLENPCPWWCVFAIGVVISQLVACFRKWLCVFVVGGAMQEQRETLQNLTSSLKEWSRLKFIEGGEVVHGGKDEGVAVPSTVRRWAGHLYISLPRWKVGSTSRSRRDKTCSTKQDMQDGVMATWARTPIPFFAYRTPLYRTE